LKLRCKMAGKDVRALDGQPLACRQCTGIIEIGDNYVRLKIRTKLSLPRIPYALFNCPATLADPTKSDKVEIIE